MEVPPKLLEDCSDEAERAALLGRFAVLDELGYFGEETSLKIALGNYKGTFTAAVRRRFSNVYGNVEGCSAADIEVAAELLGVLDDVYDYDLKERSGTT